MYRKETWAKGYYIDSHEKYLCFGCKKTFIVGAELLNRANRDKPICPYCGNESVEWNSGTSDEQLEDLADYMGCLGIYIDDDEENLENLNEEEKCI